MVVSILGRGACAFLRVTIVCSIILIAIPAMSQPDAGAINDPQASEVQRLSGEIEELKRTVDELKAELGQRYRPFKALEPNAADVGPPPPTANVPSPIVLSSSSVVNDMTCRPKLSVKDDLARPSGCERLNPATRLLLENLSAAVTGSYTNIAGSQNISAELPITQTATTTYQVGIGYKGKPILTQIRAFWDEDEDHPRAVTNQGTAWEDFLFNAVQLNAVIGYGEALTERIPLVSAQRTRNQRTQSASHIRLISKGHGVHLIHSGDLTRPVDPGYHYTPPCSSYWDGKVCK